MKEEAGLGNTDERAVHLPLEKIKKCSVCSKTKELRICSNCAEKVYCSPECQKADWPGHKPKCGKTDRIDLSAFYPLISALIESTRVHIDKPLHPALTHTIVNSPNPSSEGVCEFPDGSCARLILLGEKIEPFGPLSDTPAWWPTAESDSVRAKLKRRFISEGYLLPALVATCFALLAEMYTTTSISSSESKDGKAKRRIRLKYHNSPIADFGIAKGRADVKNQDRFAYFSLTDQRFMKGQDPDDHYWIYFTTAAGEDLLLDCGMFTFNFCMMVNIEPYTKYGLHNGLLFAPSYFRNRELKRYTPNLQYEKQRFSVLRNASLGEAVRYSSQYIRMQDAGIICSFMEKIAGRQCSSVEKDLVITWCLEHCEVIYRNLVTREYNNYPKEPALAIHTDPGEMDNMPAYEDEAWWTYMKKWNRKQRLGKITSDQLGEAFQAWREAPPEERTNANFQPNLPFVKKKKHINRQH